MLCLHFHFPICLVSLTLSLSHIKAMATVAAAAARRAAALTRLSSPQTSSPHLIHRRGLAGAAGNFFALTFISIYIRALISLDYRSYLSHKIRSSILRFCLVAEKILENGRRKFYSILGLLYGRLGFDFSFLCFGCWKI